MEGFPVLELHSVISRGALLLQGDPNLALGRRQAVGAGTTGNGGDSWGGDEPWVRCTCQKSPLPSAVRGLHAASRVVC